MAPEKANRVVHGLGAFAGHLFRQQNWPPTPTRPAAWRPKLLFPPETQSDSQLNQTTTGDCIKGRLIWLDNIDGFHSNYWPTSMNETRRVYINVCQRLITRELRQPSKPLGTWYFRRVENRLDSSGCELDGLRPRWHTIQPAIKVGSNRVNAVWVLSLSIVPENRFKEFKRVPRINFAHC